MRAAAEDEHDVRKQVRRAWGCARRRAAGASLSKRARARAGACGARRSRREAVHTTHTHHHTHTRARAPEPPPPCPPQVEVQAETEMMIPDTMRRLGKAVEDLAEFVVRRRPRRGRPLRARCQRVARPWLHSASRRPPPAGHHSSTLPPHRPPSSHPRPPAANRAWVHTLHETRGCRPPTRATWAAAPSCRLRGSSSRRRRRAALLGRSSWWRRSASDRMGGSSSRLVDWIDSCGDRADSPPSAAQPEGRTRAVTRRPARACAPATARSRPAPGTARA